MTTYLNTRLRADRGRPHNARRGIVLLIVLALLALFAVTGIAYVMVTAHYRRASESLARVGQQTVSPEDDLHEAAMQILVGDDSYLSSIWPHSLLEDMYGSATLEGTVTKSVAAKSKLSGQLLSFAPSNPITDIKPRVGSVLTMLNGLAAGKSTRIVKLDSDGVWLTAFDGVDTLALVNQINNNPTNTYKFIINGSAFSGTGVGYDASASSHPIDQPWLNTSDADGPFALQPNPSADYRTHLENDGLTINNGLVQVNEDYDAVDYQNMLLAQEDSTGVPIPSLHRPSLIKWWIAKIGGGPVNNAADWQTWATANPDLARKICLRPLDPDFDGSNSSFDPLDPATWDVDTDGDGTPDAIWVDIGLPVRSLADGRKYRPLVAIKCVDLDGRLNLNAHGNLAQCPQSPFAATAFDLPTDSAGSSPLYPVFNGQQLFAGNATTANLPHGQGVGPAEVNLASYLGETDLFELLQSRYGVDDPANPSRPGFRWPGSLTAAQTSEILLGNQNFNFSDYTAAPYDMSGTMTVGIDLSGAPVWRVMDTLSHGTNVRLYDNPYELNLTGSGGTNDAPFTPDELERLLRPFDRDSQSLADRLATIGSGALDTSQTSNAAVRHQVTTESWDVPVIADRFKLHSNTNIDATVYNMLPYEVKAGLKMDLNRKFDDGQVVYRTPSDADINTGTTGNYSDGVDNVKIDAGTTVDTSTPAGSRIAYAQQLYIMLMAVTDTNWDPDWVDSTLYDALWKRRAHALAQFAVNVVDFRDADSVMTYFRYDPNLTDGWDTKSVANGGTWDPAWGCAVFGTERPELLISETLALHDRQSEDRSDDSTGKLTTDSPGGDTDFDQRYRPMGSLFVELYNPWSRQQATGSSLGGTAGVDLSRLAPDDTPVWRLAVMGSCVEPTDNDGDARKPEFDYNTCDKTVATNIPARTVYFTNFNDAIKNAADATAEQTQSYNLNGSPTGPVPFFTGVKDLVVEPQEYAVIASADSNLADETLIGSGANSIKLNATGTGGQITVNGLTTSGVTVVPVDLPCRLSVSEPDFGYEALETASGVTPTPPVMPGTPYYTYNATVDSPLDLGANVIPDKNGTFSKFRTVHLQRLANPELDFDPVTNPYLTIDVAQIDLNVFNGVQDYTGITSTATIPDNGDFYFSARERGESSNTSGTMYDLFSAEFPDPITEPQGAGGSQTAQTVTGTFSLTPQETLGYLNEPYGTPRVDNGNASDPINQYVGMPDDGKPFAPLWWLNRPFVSEGELMYVPMLSSSRLLMPVDNGSGKVKVGYVATATNAENPNPYDVDSLGPFPYTMNFFNSDDSGKPLQLHRLMQYVRVPSRFAGTTLQIGPTATGNVVNYPWFTLSTYREPGKINLNTIFDKTTFQCLMDCGPDVLGVSGADVTAFWDEFEDSREGLAKTAPLNCPTAFGNPFRGPAGKNLTPLVGLTNDVGEEVQATVYRADTSEVKPLFGTFETADIYRNGNVSPQMRYRDLARLQNLVTTRSNVYACWITLGYFEVEGRTADAAHPDGYWLGAELGSDTGDVNRHRAFYIFDRSIPVGFQRGKSLNAENAILVRRFIE